MDGIVLIDKPKGITSHDVVEWIRRRFAIAKVGHAGTLDPMATGLLIILLGRSTRLFAELSGADKEYEATLALGLQTETGDIEGRVKAQSLFDTFGDPAALSQNVRSGVALSVNTEDTPPGRRDYRKSQRGVSECVEKIDEERIKKVFLEFTGVQEQVPPMYSALKKQGKKLYQLARKGLSVERAPRQILIHKLELLRFNPPEIDFSIHCSKGTYIRTLAEDVAKALGTCGCLSALRRTACGPFNIKDAVGLEEVNEGHIRNWSN